MPERPLPDAVPEAPKRLSLLSPWVVFPLLLLAVVASVLLTPTTGRQGDPRLTTLSRDAQGARGLADGLARLGWTVARDSAIPAVGTPLRTDVVHAVLAPAEGITAREVGRYLDAARGGAGLLVALGGGAGGFADSLGLERSDEGAPAVVPDLATAGCPADEPKYAINWNDGNVWSWWLTAKRPLPADTVHFLAVNRPLTRAERRRAGLDTVPMRDTSDLTPRQPAPAAIGMPLGRGRVIVVADPDWLRNDVVRVCKWHAAVANVRMLEWLAGAERARRAVVFDEYHQGRGQHPSAIGTLGRFLGGHPIGRTLVMAAVGALLLVAASGGRALVPLPGARIERRSPLEHVGALARAYEQVGATRMVARRLVRGLRRRSAAGTFRALPDEQWLAALAERHPKLAPEIGVVRDALTQPRTPAELLAVGRAVAHIERTILQ